MTISLSEKKRMTSLALQSFCKQLPAPRYDVRIVFPDGRAWPREWYGAQLASAEIVGFLRAKNMQGDAAIFIRPIGHRFVLVDFDDDGYERLRRMVEDGVPIRYAAETSPNHVQAWVFVGWRSTVEQQAALARSLAIKYGGDMGAAHEKQLGRAPGFFNRKPLYRNDVGHFPLVQQIPHRRDKLISEPRNVPRTEAVTPSAPLARRAARGTGAHVTKRLTLSTDASEERAYSGPLEIYNKGSLVSTFSALPDLGSVEDAYANAERLLEQEGYTPKLRADGQTDRSLHDLRVAEAIILCGYGVQYAVSALVRGSGKALARSTIGAIKYASDRVALALAR